MRITSCRILWGFKTGHRWLTWEFAWPTGWCYSRVLVPHLSLPHGIAFDEVEATFGRIGDSWRKRSERTRNGLRVLHDKLGEGCCARSRLAPRGGGASRSSNTSGQTHEPGRFVWRRRPRRDLAAGSDEFGRTAWRGRRVRPVTCERVRHYVPRRPPVALACAVVRERSHAAADRAGDPQSGAGRLAP